MEEMKYGHLKSFLFCSGVMNYLNFRTLSREDVEASAGRTWSHVPSLILLISAFVLADDE